MAAWPLSGAHLINKSHTTSASFKAAPQGVPRDATVATTVMVASYARTAPRDGRELRHVSRQQRACAAHAATLWAGQHCRRLEFPQRARTALCRAQSTPNSGARGSSSIATSQYLGRGPYTASAPVQLNFIVGQGRSDAVDCTLTVFLPRGSSAQQSQQRWPLLALSAGFLLHSGLYGSYASDLTSWGLAVALYDLPELVDDVTMVSALGSILDACTGDPRVSPYVDARAILLAGHSRGGKLSVLAAASDPRVKGVALLDPVDVTGMTPTGPGYPSALPAIRTACGPPRNLPALVVGAARNAGVIPANANYKRFVSSCPGPCWFLELTGAGHLQFLDAKVDLFSAFVESGPTPDEAVRRVSKAAVLAWALELAVPLARGEAVNGRQVVERLQQTAALLERQAPLASTFKGFDTLAGSTSGRAARTGGGAAAAAAATGASSSATSSSTHGGGCGSAAGSYGSGGCGAGACADGDARQTETGPQCGAASAAQPTGGSVGGRWAGRSGGCARWSYEELMQMRARELKAILVDRGVECSDCYEKEDLARRILERC